MHAEQSDWGYVWGTCGEVLNGELFDFKKEQYPEDMYENATEKGTIDTMPEILGLAVWHEGHIGIYIGNGEVIEAMRTKYGVVRTKLSGSQWTHWLKIPYITYVEEGSESDDNTSVEEVE